MTGIVDCVVVAYRSGDVLPACIKSLQADPVTGRIFVVNNSPDFSLGITADDGVTIIEPGENLGFGCGVNRARGHVSTELVAIVNPDVVVEPGTLAACADYVTAHPDVAILSPRVYVGGQLFRTSEWDASLLRYLAYPVGLGGWMGVERAVGVHARTHETQAINGAFMVARCGELDRVDWFDESIFLFGEEIDLCRRLRQAGQKVVYLAEGRVDHIDGHSTGSAPFDVQAVRRQARVEQLRRARGPRRARLYERILSLSRRR